MKSVPPLNHAMERELLPPPARSFNEWEGRTLAPSNNSSVKEKRREILQETRSVAPFHPTAPSLALHRNDA